MPSVRPESVGPGLAPWSGQDEGRGAEASFTARPGRSMLAADLRQTTSMTNPVVPWLGLNSLVVRVSRSSGAMRSDHRLRCSCRRPADAEEWFYVPVTGTKRRRLNEGRPKIGGSVATKETDDTQLVRCDSDMSTANGAFTASSLLEQASVCVRGVVWVCYTNSTPQVSGSI